MKRRSAWTFSRVELSTYLEIANGRSYIRLGIQQSQLRGSFEGRSERADAERAVKVALVGVDRVDREAQLRAYLLGRAAVGHESQDLHLAVGEPKVLADGRAFARFFEHAQASLGLLRPAAQLFLLAQAFQGSAEQGGRPGSREGVALVEGAWSRGVGHQGSEVAGAARDGGSHCGDGPRPARCPRGSEVPFVLQVSGEDRRPAQQRLACGRGDAGGHGGRMIVWRGTHAGDRHAEKSPSVGSQLQDLAAVGAQGYCGGTGRLAREPAKVRAGYDELGQSYEGLRRTSVLCPLLWTVRRAHHSQAARLLSSPLTTNLSHMALSLERTASS